MARRPDQIAAAIGLGAVMAAMTAQAAAPTEKEILQAAMDAPSGEYESEVGGRVAEMIRGALGNPRAKVFVKVKALKSFAQEGCKQLQYSYSADTPVITKDGREVPFGLVLKSNVCRDGLPPAEAISPDAVGSVFKAKDRGAVDPSPVK